MDIDKPTSSKLKKTNCCCTKRKTKQYQQFYDDKQKIPDFHGECRHDQNYIYWPIENSSLFARIPKEGVARRPLKLQLRNQNSLSLPSFTHAAHPPYSNLTSIGAISSHSLLGIDSIQSQSSSSGQASPIPRPLSACGGLASAQEQPRPALLSPKLARASSLKQRPSKSPIADQSSPKRTKSPSDEVHHRQPDVVTDQPILGQSNVLLDPTSNVLFTIDGMPEALMNEFVDEIPGHCNCCTCCECCGVSITSINT